MNGNESDRHILDMVWAECQNIRRDLKDHIKDENVEFADIRDDVVNESKEVRKQIAILHTELAKTRTKMAGVVAVVSAGFTIIMNVTWKKFFP